MASTSSNKKTSTSEKRVVPATTQEPSREIKTIKLSPIFTKKINTHNESYKELSEVNRLIGEKTVELELLKANAVQKNSQLMSNQQTLIEDLKAEYGEFRFTENAGEIQVLE